MFGILRGVYQLDDRPGRLRRDKRGEVDVLPASRGRQAYIVGVGKPGEPGYIPQLFPAKHLAAVIRLYGGSGDRDPAGGAFIGKALWQLIGDGGDVESGGAGVRDLDGVGIVGGCAGRDSVRGHRLLDLARGDRGSDGWVDVPLGVHSGNGYGNALTVDGLRVGNGGIGGGEGFGEPWLVEDAPKSLFHTTCRRGRARHRVGAPTQGREVRLYVLQERNDQQGGEQRPDDRQTEDRVTRLVFQPLLPQSHQFLQSLRRGVKVKIVGELRDHVRPPIVGRCQCHCDASALTRELDGGHVPAHGVSI